MKLLPTFNFEAAAIGHEISNNLVPMVEERVHKISSSADQHIMAIANRDLGEADIAEIMLAIENDISQAPPVAEARAQAVGDIVGAHTVSGAEAVIQKEQQSGFWGDTPEDQKLVQSAGWDGDLAAVADDPSKLQTEVTAEQFFQSDFQLIPQSVIEQPAPVIGNADYRTSQDTLQEAGFASPLVDETRQFMDDLAALPEMTDPSVLDNQSPEAIAAQLSAARQQVSEAV